jgi:hypothetical protein
VVQIDHTIWVYGTPMKAYKILRFISIVAYFSIIFNGQMICLPFICLLTFSIIEFGSRFNLMAILAGIGFLLLFIPFKEYSLKASLRIHVVAFLLLLSPLVERLISVPLYLFNYASFIVPCVIFLLFYILSTVFLYADFKRGKSEQELLLNDIIG